MDTTGIFYPLHNTVFCSLCKEAKSSTQSQFGGVAMGQKSSSNASIHGQLFLPDTVTVCVVVGVGHTCGIEPG